MNSEHEDAEYSGKHEGASRAMGDQERRLERTPRGDVQVTIYPLVVPDDLQSVHPIGALIPEADRSTIQSDELDPLTYRSSGGFSYPRERLDDNFNHRVQLSARQTRQMLSSEGNVTALIAAMTDEFHLASEAVGKIAARPRRRRRLPRWRGADKQWKARHH